MVEQIIIVRDKPTVSESIWSNKDVTIPMAEVSFIEKRDNSIYVIMKHSRWQEEYQHWSPMVHLYGEQGKQFLSDWCYYRYEVEKLSKQGTMKKDVCNHCGDSLDENGKCRSTIITPKKRRS